VKRKLDKNRGRNSAQALEAEEKRRTLDLRDTAFGRCLWIHVSVLILTSIIILLQGWHIHQFNLPDAFLHWLGAATIGENAAFLYLMVRFVFSTPPAPPRSRGSISNLPRHAIPRRPAHTTTTTNTNAPCSPLPSVAATLPPQGYRKECARTRVRGLRNL
jgi:hypothetical protein